LSESECQVHRHRSFADAALAAGDRDDSPTHLGDGEGLPNSLRAPAVENNRSCIQ
jgi:hypothetical protein